MPPVTDKLGKLLISANLITEKQLNEALVAIRQSKGATRLGSTLVKMGYIQEEKLLQFLSQQYRVPAVDLKMYQHIDPAIIKLVPLELVKKHMVDRKSTRLNSSHVRISYAVFCLKKKKKKKRS